MDLLENAEAKN